MRRLGWACGLAVIVLLAYLPAFSAGYVYEDHVQLAQLTHQAPLGPRVIADWLWQAFPGALEGHVVSLSLHLVVGLLLWAFLRRLAVSALTASVAVLVFLRHPLTVESVAYLSARTELIAAIGVLGACAVAAGQWRWWTLPAIGLACLVGLGGKDSGAVVLGLVPLTLWAIGSDWWEPAAWVGGLGVVLGLIIIGPITLLNYADYYQISGLEWLLAQSAAAHRLIALSAWPFGLTPDPDIDLITQGWRIAAVGLLAGLAIVAYRLKDSRPLVTLGLAWTLCGILPRLLVQTPRGYLNDHQFYLPLIGLTIAFAAAWDSQQEAA